MPLPNSKRRASTALAETPDTISLYVHWPFCLSLCPYCDFNSHVADTAPGREWADALVAELDHFGSETTGRRLDSVFFGGGTPSLMASDTVAAVLDAATRYWRPADDLEVTLEANPTSVEARQLAAFRGAGVNRVSLGVQALRNDALAALGRTHSVAEALTALDVAQATFDRVSFDLIYARPGQTVADWAQELDEAVALGAGHMSVYQLTIEPGTRFFLLHGRGDLVVPDGDSQAAQYEHTQTRLTAAEMPAYEISNHAAPGAECRHNLRYWRGDDFVGIGPGAHGRLTLDGEVVATRQHRAPAKWLELVGGDGHATRTRQTLDAAAVRDELVLMGLRTAEGVTRQRFAARAGDDWDTVFARGAVARLTDAGFLIEDSVGVRATAAGRQRLGAVIDALLAA